MRIALVYPPPWKIDARQGAGLEGAGLEGFGAEGPPAGYRDGDLDGDFYQTPYGLFTIAAQAIRAGHQVKVLNLSAYRWAEVEEVLGALEADVYGMSCWTANRRGVGYTAELIRRRHPKSVIVVGGPHASPLAHEMLSYHPAIDVATSGESDITFLEIVERVARGASFTGLAGASYRTARGLEKGPPRELVHDLDSLASPHRLFDTHIVMTSRGCPWACTFCGAESQWGRGFRGNSVPYVLDALESAVSRLPVKMVMIKDDTFTTQKKRVLELCRGIRERGLSFVWSCDTRVDLLSDELLYEMRLAGCARLSLGVESGAPDILKQVDKKITVDDILESTELAKKYGIKLRYYMMLGNRGETEETFRQTLDFLATAKPHEYIFSCLSIYPGTRDFHDAEQAGWLDRKVFFEETFQELKIPFDASEGATRMMNDWFAGHAGLQVAYRESVAEEKAILARLGDFAPAHLDVAGACFAAGDVAEAELHARKALDLGHPLPGLCYNYLACAAVERGDYDAMMDLYSEAARRDPQHPVLIRNVNAARAWFKRGGPASGPLRLEAQHDFRVLERTAQPTLPGPLPSDFARWEPNDDAAIAPTAEPTLARVGSQLPLGDRKSLKVL
jgi:radical SAM superfamily enzyme YgiQ (UPF0313 family)